MGEKIDLVISVDKDVYEGFILSAYFNNDNVNSTLEKFMRSYVDSSTYQNEDYNAWTTKLIKKCTDEEEFKSIGNLLKYVLRKLLEQGVASDKIEQLQQASGRVPIRNFNLESGFYVNDNFAISQPLLIEHKKWKQYCKGGNPFSADWFFIGNKKFHFCSQWTQADDQRKKILEWIETNLNSWFIQADKHSCDEMIRWIESL